MKLNLNHSALDIYAKQNYFTIKNLNKDKTDDI